MWTTIPSRFLITVAEPQTRSARARRDDGISRATYAITPATSHARGRMRALGSVRQRLVRSAQPARVHVLDIAATFCGGTQCDLQPSRRNDELSAEPQARPTIRRDDLGFLQRFPSPPSRQVRARESRTGVGHLGGSVGDAARPRADRSRRGVAQRRARSLATLIILGPTGNQGVLITHQTC